MKKVLAILAVIAVSAAVAEASLYDRMVAYYEHHTSETWPEVGDGPWQLYDDGYGNVTVAGVSAPEDISVFAAFPVPVKVPQVVTKFRFWLAFHGATGMTNRDVEAVILAWDDGVAKDQALIALDSARDYRRLNPFVDTLRVQAGMTAEQMDAVFIAASQLEVD